MVGPAALEDTDYTARIDLTGLPDGQRISYRVLFQSLSDLRVYSEPVEGIVPHAARLVADARRHVRLLGGLRRPGLGHRSCRAAGCGSTMRCSARSPTSSSISATPSTPTSRSQPEVPLDDGSVWRNVVTEAKSHVAQTLDDFRGCHQYNLQDEHMRRFNAAVPQVVLWDDHEVRDNWYPTQRLDARPALHGEERRALVSAREARVPRLSAARGSTRSTASASIARGATDRLLEIFALDMRSYRGPNSPNQPDCADVRTSAILGAAQVAWLEASAGRRRHATWKVIASDMPIGLVVPDGPDDFEAVANRDDGAPLGRELEIAQIAHASSATARSATSCGSRRTCTTARRTTTARRARASPSSIRSGSSSPGRCTPARSDRTSWIATFGPEVKFIGIPPGMKPNRPPSEPYPVLRQRAGSIAARRR